MDYDPLSGKTIGEDEFNRRYPNAGGFKCGPIETGVAGVAVNRGPVEEPSRDARVAVHATKILSLIPQANVEANTNMDAIPDRQVMIPKVHTLPDEAALSREISGRPNWPELFAQLEGLTGKDLVEAGTFGQETAQLIAEMDKDIKQYQPLFLEWYWNSPFGRSEKNGEEYRQGIRLPEMKRCDNFRAKCSLILGQMKLEEHRRDEAQRRVLEGEQRRLAEEQRKQEIAAAPEEHRAAIAAEPIVPVAVSKAQVVAISSTPRAPSTISGRTVYDREIIDMTTFLKWLAEHPNMAGVLKVSANFTALKSQNTVIPGVKLTQRVDVRNTGK